MKISKSITPDEEIWEEIDNNRGDINRSKFIENIIKKGLKGGIQK